MVENIRKNIYRIEVPLKGSPLKALNAYLLRGDGEDYLIDTGFNTEDCENALRAGLLELKCDINHLNVINTHLHADHSGLDYAFTGEKKNCFLSSSDFESLKKFYFGVGFQREKRDLKEGISEELFLKMKASTPSKMYRTPHYDLEKMKTFEDGYTFHIGDLELKAIVVPGHTIGNTMFWCEKEGIMFTGDHILFDITPNISTWMEMDDPLKQYLDNLDRVYDYDVKLALPGHRKPGNYHERIDAIKMHHEKRLREILDIIEKNPGITAYEITQKMTWKIRLNEDGSFPLTQLYFATGEAISHLDCLLGRGLIEKTMEEPYFRYKVK